MKRSVISKATRSFLFALPIAVALLGTAKPSEAAVEEAHICSCGVTCDGGCASVCCDDE